jgi:hypothetical protein
MADGDLQGAVAKKSDDTCDGDATIDPLSFEFCGDHPCVWLREMENVVAVYEME